MEQINAIKAEIAKLRAGNIQNGIQAKINRLHEELVREIKRYKAEQEVA